ncbi:hypothetical protein BC941DRAFT_442462 [Chlamydoabsidia padenii]|nr:hypothetical protein BC941DRAFT_442462 [Chlamydoabsidia padenii]
MLVREEGPTEATNEYHWGHTGHTPGSIQDMASAPISRDARLALQQLIENKMTWISIEHLLRGCQSAGINYGNGGKCEYRRINASHLSVGVLPDEQDDEIQVST